MTTGAGATLIGGWFGTGADRGLALLFTVAGALGLIVTLLAMRSVAYRVLSREYRHARVPVALVVRDAPTADLATVADLAA